MFFKKDAYIKINHIYSSQISYDYIPSTMSINIEKGGKTIETISGIEITRENIKRILAELVYCKDQKLKELEFTFDSWYIFIPRWAFDKLIWQLRNYFSELMLPSMAKEIIEDTRKESE